jgi:hypothetical protein
MNSLNPSPRSGITGLLAVFCFAALLAGIGFDLGAGARAHFWIGAQPAAAAALGIAAAVAAVLVSRLARAVLSRGQRQERSRDARADT